MLHDSVAMIRAPAETGARGASSTVEESAHVLHYLLVGQRTCTTVVAILSKLVSILLLFCSLFASTALVASSTYSLRSLVASTALVASYTYSLRSLVASTVLVASSAYSLGSLYASNALVASSAYSFGSFFASTALVPSK